MRGLDWAALPVIVEILGIVDVEQYVAKLIALRDWQTDNPAETYRGTCEFAYRPHR